VTRAAPARGGAAAERGGVFPLLVEALKEYAIYVSWTPDGVGLEAGTLGARRRIKGYLPGEVHRPALLFFSKFYTPRTSKAGKPWEALATPRA
jgi:hypothetical protein